MQLLFGTGSAPVFPGEVNVVDGFAVATVAWLLVYNPFMGPTFYDVTGMGNGALRRIAAHFVPGFPTHNPTHKKYVLYDFRVLWQSPRSSKLL